MRSIPFIFINFGCKCNAKLPFETKSFSYEKVHVSKKAVHVPIFCYVDNSSCFITVDSTKCAGAVY